MYIGYIGLLGLNTYSDIKNDISIHLLLDKIDF